MNTSIKGTIGGKEIGLRFLYARITQGVFQHSEIHLELGHNKEQASAVHQNAVSSWIGKALELKVFEVDRASEILKIHSGVINAVDLEDERIRITAVSEDFFLKENRRYRSFVDRTLIEIVNEILKEREINAELISPEKSIALRFLQEYDESDFDFLQRMAGLDGCVFFHDGEKFHYWPKLKGTEAVKLNTDLKIDKLRLKCSLLGSKYRGAPYNPLAHDEASALPLQPVKPSLPNHPYSSSIFNASQKHYGLPTGSYDAPLEVRSEFEKCATNQQMAAISRMVILDGTTNHPQVVVGKILDDPQNSTASDKFVVTKIEAELTGNVYSAKFEAMLRDAIVAPEPNGSLARSLTLMQPADVVDNKDPNGLGRVQIRYLWDQEKPAYAWARVLQIGAGVKGSSYGTHFIPRIGDQVLVAWEHGQPSLPIVLGALYHSEHKPDFVTENGTEEVLVVKTPGQSTIRVIDKQGSEEILVSMKDRKNLIRLELTEPRITVESVGGTIEVHSKTIELRADEKVRISAQDIEVAAGKSIDVSAGKNHSAKIGGDMVTKVGGSNQQQVGSDNSITVGGNLTEKIASKAELSAGASVKIIAPQVETSASATNTIKGALVRIN